MKIIDICENFSAYGCLKQYYENNNIKDYMIFALEMYLSIGDIKNNRLDFLKKLHKKCFGYNYTYNYNEVLNELYQISNEKSSFQTLNNEIYQNKWVLLYKKNVCRLLYVTNHKNK